LELVTWLTASWPGGYSSGSAAVLTDRSCGGLVEMNRYVLTYLFKMKIVHEVHTQSKMIKKKEK